MTGFFLENLGLGKLLSKLTDLYIPIYSFFYSTLGYSIITSFLKPYFGDQEPSPLMLQAIMQGLEEFQEKMSTECDDKFKNCNEQEG